jgi:hypothetical protein
MSRTWATPIGMMTWGIPLLNDLLCVPVEERVGEVPKRILGRGEAERDSEAEHRLSLSDRDKGMKTTCGGCVWLLAVYAGIPLSHA